LGSAWGLERMETGGESEGQWLEWIAGGRLMLELGSGAEGTRRARSLAGLEGLIVSSVSRARDAVSVRPQNFGPKII
jgi:hypothetical protein